jgi:chromosome segregation ATPase
MIKMSRLGLILLDQKDIKKDEEISQLNAKINDLEKKLQNSIAKCEYLNTKIKLLELNEQEVKRLQKLLDQNEAEFEKALQRKLKEQENQYKIEIIRLKHINETMRKINIKEESSHGSNEEINKVINDLQQKVNSLNRKIINLNDQNEAYKEENKNQNEIIINLKSELTEIYAKQNKETHKKSSNMSNLIEQINRVQNETDELTRQHEKLKKKHEFERFKWKEERLENDKDMRSLKLEISSLKAQNRELRAKVKIDLCIV